MNFKFFKKNFFIAIISIFILITSCTDSLTNKMWNNNFYTEVFYHFLISNDGQFIVFLNNKNHYVFNDQSGIIKKLLTWKKGRVALRINTEKTILKIDNKLNVVADVVIDADIDQLDNVDLATLGNLGFKTNQKKLTLNFRTFGKRYLPSSDIPNSTPKLSAPYNLKVFYQITKNQKLLKASLTPITILVDGIMISGKILTYPFTD